MGTQKIARRFARIGPPAMSSGEAVAEAGVNKVVSVQAVRGAAAVLIVIFHSKIAISGLPDKSAVVSLPFLYTFGYYAVNLFFAVSGFIICYIWHHSKDMTVSGFIIRRVFRLYPVYFLFCILAVVWFRSGLPQLGDNPGYDNIFRSVLMLPQIDMPIYEVGWTLEHEIIFYLLAAVFMPLLGEIGLAVVLFGLGTAGLWRVPELISGNSWVDHLASPVQFDFLAGVLAYIFFGRLRLHWSILMLAGAVAYYLGTQQVAFAVSIGSFLFLSAALNIDFSRLPTASRVALWVGDLSYSLYLVHWTVVHLFSLASFHITQPWLAEPLRLAAIAISIVLARLLFVFLERPTIAMGRSVEAWYSAHALKWKRAD